MHQQLATSKLNDDERKRFMRMINNSSIWKDPSSQTPESIANGINIQPFKTMSSYHLWMRRNIFPMDAANEYIYISGANLIRENCKTKQQKFIQLMNNCNVTSMFVSRSSSNDLLMFIGEKVEKTEDKKFISGRVEIINLEPKMMPKKILFDLSVYEEYDSYVHDIVSPNKSDICLIILKNLEKSKPNSKIFIWNFLTMSLLAIEEFKFELDCIVKHPIQPDVFLIYGYNYLAIWKFDLFKKQMILVQTIYDKNCDEITTAGFIKEFNQEGIMIGFKNEWFEIFMLKDISTINTNNEETINDNSPTNHSINKQSNEIKKAYKLYLRINYFNLFHEDWVNIQNRSQSSKEAMDENLIPPDFLSIRPNFGTEKIRLGAKKNYIFNIISRKNFLLIFLNKSSVIIILEIVEINGETKFKLSNFELLPYKNAEYCSILISRNFSTMIISNGEPCYKFYAALQQNRESFRDSDESAQENLFTLKAVVVSYYKYKINTINGIPNFEMEEIILPNTGLGYPANFVAVSESPRIFLINNGLDAKDLYFFHQRIPGNLNDYLKANGYEGGSQSYIQLRKEFYKQNTNFEFFINKRLEEKPLSITFSPLGKSLFITYKDSGYFYVILEKEFKEMFKITMYCRGCAFDDSGTYLAFATSEFDNEYTINVLNVATYEYEYMITKVPPPVKLKFIDGAKILVSRFDDNSTNLLAWKLEWNQRLIENYIGNTKEKTTENSNQGVIFKITDFTGSIIDFDYDASLDQCIITSQDHRERVYQSTNNEEKFWQFYSDCKYMTANILKKYDSIIFGTEYGSLRTCLWPIQNILNDSNADHPLYNELNLHCGKITSVFISQDNEFLYSSAEDGSVYISCITPVFNMAPVTLKNFYYFNQANVLPKSVFYDSNDILYITEPMYLNKVSIVKKKKSAIQSQISEFQSNKEKLMQQNGNTLDKKREDLTEQLELKVKLVKDKENEKEKETKKLKDDRDYQIKLIKDELGRMKKEFKELKEDKQIETTKLINCIKIANEKFKDNKNVIENLRNKTNNAIASSLENMYQIMQDKKNEVDKMIKEKTKKFKLECEKNENEYESYIRKRESEFKVACEEFEEKKKEIENEILKKDKDNKNYDDKINEWDNHLKELKINNEELMETYIFNTLKLNQMNQLLTDNENKISVKEKIVKEKRQVNDRLEQLRFVLEYQIKNLILEKTPIEEQIKNFESLHSDFYKRFNLLYTELLNIGDLIKNNEKCIETYRKELAETKKSLYRLKNLYKSIDVALNSILKNKLDTKKDIIDQIFNVYQTYLYTFNDAKKQTKVISAEMKLQTKSIEKEIYSQKNNVLKELIEKRTERRKIINEKEEMMKDIRLDNQLLIQECSNIRENLEDILKNINDIEKKFIELTNNNNFLSDKDNIDEVNNIKGKIKEAKGQVLLSDADKIRVGKSSGLELPVIRQNNNSGKNKGKNIKYGDNNVNGLLNPNDLLRKQMKNAEEIRKQGEDVDKMKQQLKDLVGEHEESTNKVNYGLSGSVNNSNKKLISGQNDGRILAIKTKKYYDSKEGDIKK